ncbi:MAG: type II toxin-antitoxin system RelB/DinJ family antitoxin [Eggerthellaceae bacterium]|nr:type II toxin-antitoxin system RelB/DinJ family antitoxin [Eggerthellaceae bacterium]
MDSIVTARVPLEIKEQANEMLASIGATPTQLINAAYEYVLNNKKLPETLAPPSTAQHKTLSQERVQKLHRILDQTSFAVAEEHWQGKSYKELLAEGKKADYEALT